jgi:Rieske Fe-S protein
MTGPVTLTLTRRAVVRGGVFAVVGAIAGWSVAHNSAAAKRSTGSAAANGYAPKSSAGGRRRLVAAASVPTGGGVVIDGAKVVVTRDSSGAVHGFSAVCTHQGCLVSSVRNGTIDCPCHGSRFDASTGRVVAGPAPAPLPPVSLTVVGGQIYAQ